MRHEHYKLVGHEAVPCELMEWAKCFEGPRHVALTEQDGFKVSTVFLGLNHSYGNGEPLIFETMVFGGSLDQDMERYSTWEQAEVGHADMVKRAEEARQIKEVVGEQPTTNALQNAQSSAS